MSLDNAIIDVVKVLGTGSLAFALATAIYLLADEMIGRISIRTTLWRRNRETFGWWAATRYRLGARLIRPELQSQYERALAENDTLFADLAAQNLTAAEVRRSERWIRADERAETLLGVYAGNRRLTLHQIRLDEHEGDH